MWKINFYAVESRIALCGINLSFPRDSWWDIPPLKVFSPLGPKKGSPCCISIRIAAQGISTLGCKASEIDPAPTLAQ